MSEGSKGVWGVAAAATLLWLLMVAFTVSLLLNERRLALERAEKGAGAMTLAMEAHTADTFRSVALVLDGVADAFSLSAPADDDPVFRAFLRARVRALPQLRAIYVIGPDGRVIHDTDRPGPGPGSLAHQAYFRQYLENETLQSDLSPSLVSANGDRFHALTRRISRDGRFEGVVVAAVVPGYFQSLYRRMGLGKGQVIDLFHKDHTRVAHYPTDDSLIGRKASVAEIYGSDHVLEPADTRIVHNGPLYAQMKSFRTVEQWPFVVTLTQGPPSLLAAWRTTVLAATLGLVVLGIVSAAFVLQLARRRQLERRAHDRLAQSERLEALGQLTSGVAHDFANLLGVLRSNLAVIERGASDELMTRAIATSERTIGNGKRLIEQLLRFARQGKLDVRPLDANAAVRSHLSMLEQAAGRDARIRLELDDSIDACLADETQLVVALLNLVANARDAMHEPGTISIRTAPVDDDECAARELARGSRYVRLTVQDPGEGMPPEVQRRAFDPFFTTKASAGTGLGLPQVYGGMRQLGGDIRIDSAPGRGTSVHLYFPAVARPAG